MAKERVSLHGEKGGSAVHNEHDFMNEKDVSIIRYAFEKKDDGKSLKDGELYFYKQRYSATLDKQNDKYKRKGNYDRIKTMEEYYQCKNYKPTEAILQYGNMTSGNLPSKDEFDAMMEQYAAWLNDWSNNHGNHLHVLNAAMHHDEATPHAHLRYIWDAVDAGGNIVIKQEEAMAQAGIALPDPNKPVGRFNNRGMTFTAMCRDKWQDICESHGFAVERTPLDNGRQKHETVPEYHSRKARELEAREKEVEEKEACNQKLQDDNQRLRKERDNAELLLLDAESIITQKTFEAEDSIQIAKSESKKKEKLLADNRKLQDDNQRLYTDYKQLYADKQQLENTIASQRKKAIEDLNADIALKRKEREEALDRDIALKRKEREEALDRDIALKQDEFSTLKQSVSKKVNELSEAEFRLDEIIYEITLKQDTLNKLNKEINRKESWDPSNIIQRAKAIQEEKAKQNIKQNNTGLRF